MNDYNFEKIEPFDFEEYYEYNYQLEIKNEEFKEFFY